ncbi:Xaa-Pro aminopeptidase [Cronobacter sakazakii]|nr:Xaa-Pro aminopeptidase [Cronobacter sakazakii]
MNGKFTPAQRAVYDIVLESLETALRLFRPGTSIQDVTGDVVRVMVKGLIGLGILKGDVEQLVAENAHRPYFMHGLSHWLGLDVHDVGFYGPDRSRILAPGMVITVEPGFISHRTPTCLKSTAALASVSKTISSLPKPAMRT